MTMSKFNMVLPDERRWTRGAACAEPGAPYMFPDETRVRDVETAKETCDGCPVKAACLAEAIERRETFGIWGGTTYSERKALIRKAASTRRV